MLYFNFFIQFEIKNCVFLVKTTFDKLLEKIDVKIEDKESFDENIEELLEELMPFYKQLYAFARRKLREVSVYCFFMKSYYKP